MAAIRFRLRNRPTLGAREAKAVGGLLTTRNTVRSLKLAEKILDLAAAKDTQIAEISLRRGEVLELLATLNERATERRLSSDEVYRLRAELEAATNRT